MEIIIKGSQAVLKNNTSFDFISENRLFTGSDSYTLTITFPLRGCAQNIAIFGHIHRADVAKEKVVFNCDIRDKGFFKTGSITITEISETEVKGQFLEGRSEQNYDETFDDIYINELSLGYPSQRSASAYDPDVVFYPYPENNFIPLPWVNNYSGNIQNELVYSGGIYSGWKSSGVELSFQPYLLYILQRICEEIGYTGNFDALENTVYQYLLICNTLPASWEAWNFALALPHWTLTEFFEQLEYFLFGEFDINHKAKTIDFAFSQDLVNAADNVFIDKVVDEYTTEVSQDDDSKYLSSSNLKYADNGGTLWPYCSCDWYIRANKDNAVVFDSMEKLLEAAKELEMSGEYLVYGHGKPTSTPTGAFYCYGYRFGSDGNKLLYCSETDQYFVMYCYKSELAKEINGSNCYRYYNRLMPVNQFGERFVDDDAEDIEMKIVPAWIDEADESYGNMLFMDSGELDDDAGWTVSSDGTATETGKRNDSADYEDGELAQGYASSRIAEGEQTETEGYYDVLYVAFWDGNIDSFTPYQPHPITDYMEITTDFKWRKWDYTLRIKQGPLGEARDKLPLIDGRKKYTFSFLSDTIPSPRATFYIRGGKYVCEKITATFHETGMSQLLKGVFYRIK